MIFMEGDQGDGLYIVDDGVIRGWILDKQLKYRPLSQELKVGCIFGEISFFLSSPRTATLQSKANSRLFFLENKYKKILYQNCPKLYKRMRLQIYSYKHDEILQFKMEFLRESVWYFKKAESKALTEICFQMVIK